MNTRMVVGIILLIIAAVYFYIVPFRSVSSTGTEIIYWANIVPGTILAILGIILLVTGRRRKSLWINKSKSRLERLYSNA